MQKIILKKLKNDENIFYKIISEKIIKQFEGEHLEILKKSNLI